MGIVQELGEADRAYQEARRRRADLMVRAADEGLTHKQIAAVLGVTRSAVSQVLREMRAGELRQSRIGRRS